MIARVVKLGEPANDAEKRAFATLRDHLPNSYTLLTNFELKNDRGDLYEIDVAILAPHTIFLVDIKGTRGRIDVYGAKWYPEGRAAFHSPLAKLRDHARVLKDMLRQYDPNLRRVYVHATVLLTAPDARIEDASGRDEPDTIRLSHCLPYFQSARHVRPGMDTNIAALLPQVEQAIVGKARPRRANLAFGNWHVENRLGAAPRYTEYRARHAMLGKSAGSVRLRVFPIDPFAIDPHRSRDQHLIATAYAALTQLPSHPNIVAARDFFETDDHDALVLVLEDISGTALRQILRREDLARTFEQKSRMARDLLNALDHAHHHGVTHRNLTPDALLVGADGTTRLTDFDYARVVDRQSIGEEISDALDPTYQAPEVHIDPSNASPLSDLFSAGLICYELFSGQTPKLVRAGESDDAPLRFDRKASDIRPDLPPDLDNWLDRLCQRRSEDRFSDAASALAALNAVLNTQPTPIVIVPPPAPSDLRNLPPGTRLGERFIVQEKLGAGKFGVVYKVFDSFGDVDRAIKLIDYDGRSTLDRLRQEYRALAPLPEHPYVIKVYWADVFRDLGDTPYLLMEYAEGLTVDEFLRADALSLDDARMIARHTAAGLDHLHRHGIYHQDIKPQNLFWTNNGIRIIDFNVAISDEDIRAQGGTLRYIPPDVDHGGELHDTDKIDRDLYALGITFYQSCTGRYPFGEGDTIRDTPRDPRSTPRGAALPDAWVQLLYRAIDARRARRFTSAGELLTAIDSLPPLRGRDTTTTFTPAPSVAALGDAPPNTNPFVSHLLTLYSQSRTTNAGTRGLDTIGELTYVPTLLDRELAPAILRGEFRLVIISGNAGDGKTAFIQKLERQAQIQGAHYESSSNGARFQIGGRTFYSNYDGSQDEGETANDDVLQAFLAPFSGNDPRRWPDDQIRLIAINEGRLIDFLRVHREQFPRLAKDIPGALAGTPSRDGVVLINLNHRAVVADVADSGAIFDQIVRKMVAPERWEACRSCDLSDRCYAHHNAQTLMDPVAGPRVIERLKTLYTATHLRGKLHITLRDLRSALAYTLVGMRDCDEIHALYQSGSEQREEIARGFYFNAWCNTGVPSGDRLLNLLRDLDVGQTDNPELDRAFDFSTPRNDDPARFSFQTRGNYDHRILKAMYDELPRQFSRAEQPAAVEQHQRYIAMVRRQYYFERRETETPGRASQRRGGMLPYRTVEMFLALVTSDQDLASETPRLLRAINRGEGLSDPDRLGERLALRVRQVERGTIRSYRLFDGHGFSLHRPTIGGSERFVEYLPQGLIFRYALPNGRPAELRITLDVYELLMRLDEGYRPSVEALEGFYQTLDVFKNVLSSAPYQEVLLTETGESFYRLWRDADGVLSLEAMGGPV